MTTTRLSLLMRVRDRSDNAAWTEFRAIYAGLLRGYVIGRSRSMGLGWRDHMVDEVVCDLIVHLWHKLPDFELDHGIGRFRTYLWRVVANFVTDRVRKDRPERNRPLEDAADPVDERTAEPIEEWNKRFNEAILRGVMAQIREETLRSNPNKWHAFERQWLGGQPAADVARELGVKPDLVYQSSSRVLNAIRVRFRTEYGEDLEV